ncbi:MAG: hypothetical protein HQK85_02380 [Nitrospinae bacterium]|nr:hypothetical protein [Nitrospinota bacterium]
MSGVSGAGPKISSGASMRRPAPQARPASSGAAHGGGMASSVSALKSAVAGKGMKINIKA